MASIHVTTSSLISFFLPKQLSVWNRTAYFATRQHQRITNPPCLSQASHPLLAFSYPLLISPAISINVPDWIGNLWESVLRAVPKKKTSHSKKRSRQRAGKALKDVTSLNKCSGCGHVKRFHVLCPFCVKAHPTDIFSLAVTSKHILSASGSSAIKIYSTDLAESSLVQTLSGAHKLGCHHIAASCNGNRAVSVGFGGEVKVWKLIKKSDEWVEEKVEAGADKEDGIKLDQNKPGEIWAIALSKDGQYLASTTYDGRINVWDLDDEQRKIREFETNGSFGMCIDLSQNGKLTASGHENGTIYVFNNETGRMMYSLPGLLKPVRAVAFSPGCTRLAAAGDAGVIAIYDVKHGEQVANLTGHSAWIFSIDWSETGEYLISGSSDGKVKVWSIDQRSFVSSYSETGQTLWSVKFIPKKNRIERFATAGASRNICLYREASGG
ncbi:Meiotic recombination protein rec14 [Golovinomyces cichoracearum]|uniref:Meiotic recombination protein rec14 n=1 Tax=Golovinomyces cichoracearum TaxID=62708 RepID=A0A420I9J3_9PEZI|nr:Meiotic recombination protein rec14 [Golovinomyces cichoracearum]